MIDHSQECVIVTEGWCSCKEPEPFRSLPIEEIPVNRKVFWDPNEAPLSHRHVRDLIEHPDNAPLHVQQTLDGKYYVLNGRHRFQRAWLDGKQTIRAKVLR